MSMEPYVMRRLAEGDAAALAAFYNGLSERSRRTFRPLGWTTTVDACVGIVRDQVARDFCVRAYVAGNYPFNQGARYDMVARDHPLDRGAKYDMVAQCAERIVGWSFVWNLRSEEPTFGLGIADAHQGRGLGAALMDRVLEAAQGLGLRRLELTVVQDNLVAWHMYERRGFERYGEFVDEKDGLAYYRMRKAL